MKKNMIIGIAIILIIVLIIIFMINQNSDEKPFLNEDEFPSIKPDADISDYSKLELSPITKSNLLGIWTAVEEETNGEINNNIKSSITFNSDNTFISESFEIPEAGVYELKQGKITFYESDEDRQKQGNFLQVWGGFKDNQLILIFPQFPKTVVYEKSNQ